jgi:hypothetical protein
LPQQRSKLHSNIDDVEIPEGSSISTTSATLPTLIEVLEFVNYPSPRLSPDRYGPLPEQGGRFRVKVASDVIDT